jgi:hypothetical protein
MREKLGRSLRLKYLFEFSHPQLSISNCIDTRVCIQSALHFFLKTPRVKFLKGVQQLEF